MHEDTCKCGSPADSTQSVAGPYFCAAGHLFWVCPDCTARHESRAAWSMCCLEMGS